MTQDKTLLLTKAFPLLYRDKGLIPFYFECHNGWFAIIYQLSAELERLIKKQKRWWKRLWRLFNRIPLPMTKVTQVKEKYGSLRFYISFGTAEMYAAINKAEKLSEKTCEFCGHPGKLHGKIWYYTLCDTCRRNLA
jgi:hypothetical protein